MAGPGDQTIRQFIVPPGEAQKLYSPGSLAQKVQNLEATPDGVLQSVLGPTVYEPSRLVGSSYTNPSGSFGEPFGIFHANLMGGAVDTLLIRAGGRLYRHAGWSRSWQQLESGLSVEHRPKFPDQFVALNDRIIWTNGIDRARVITHDGAVHLLGFSEVPNAPQAEGPANPSLRERGDFFENAFGYTWPGDIGTPGDSLDGTSGAILAGQWIYYMQWEDQFGNLSQVSTPSQPVSIFTAQADAAKDAILSDLSRQFLVRTGGDGPEHAVAFHIYRTGDTRRGEVTPRLVARVPGGREMAFPDNVSDFALGPAMVATVAVPLFRVMCTHQGRLVIGNIPGSSGLVRRSEPAFPGTFSANDWVLPDSGGAEVTGLSSHEGVLLAFTASSVYSLAEFGAPRPLSQGIGCVAPKSIKALPNGTLIWLGRDGFYGMRGGQITLLSAGIHRTIRHGLNRGRMVMATAAIDPESGEYRCAVTPAGEDHNTLILTFDGSTWRRQKFSLHVADMCQTDDWRQYVLSIGTNKPGSTSDHDVYVMGRETQSFTPAASEVVYRSAWLYGDETGLTPMHVRTMYIGMVDAYNDDVTITFYRNGSWSPVYEMTDVRTVGPDDDSGVVVDIAGSAVIGTAKLHDPRLFWRQVPVGLENVNSWAFEIRVTRPSRLRLASFAFDISVATMGNVRGRIPMRSDT